MIRWKVFIPVLLITALVTWFCLYRLDLFVKGMIEDTISAATETKTDIHRLRISLWNSSLNVERLEIASKEDPMKNAVEFSEIDLDFQMMPLLQKRFVVDEFSIEGIQWGTKRKTSGALPPKPKAKEPSMIGQLTNDAIASVKTEFDKLPISQLTNFEMPDDPKEILAKVDLNSMKAFRDAAVDAQSMRSQWTKKFDELKDFTEAKQIIANSKALARDLPQTPEAILKRVEEVQRVVNQLQNEKTKAELLLSTVKTDYARIEKIYSDARSAAEADYNRAKDLVGIDAVNSKMLIKLIFGQQWVERAQTVLRTQMMIRQKLSAMSAAGKDDSVQIQPRAKGRDIIFVTPKKEPSFVWAKSDFSVNVLSGGERAKVNQKYEFRIRDINSAPKLHGKPTEIEFKGDFKDAILASASFDGTWDYTTEVSRDIYKATAKRIRAEDWPVGIPKVFPIKMTSGFADAAVDFEYIGSDLKWSNKIKFNGVKWDFSEVPKAGMLIPILEKVFSEMHDFEIEFELTYKGKELDFNIDSDLDSHLKAGLNKVFQEKIAELQARIRREIDEKVAEVRETATKELAKAKAEVVDKAESLVNELTKGLIDSNSLIGNLQEQAKKAAAKQLQNSLGDEIKKNASKIKIPSLKIP